MSTTLVVTALTRQCCYALETAENVHKYLSVSLLEYTHFQHTSTTMMLISSEDIPYGLRIATNSSKDLPSIKITITWLLMNAFTIVTLDMDSAPHVEYSDAVPCGASVDINNYQMD